MRGIDQSTIGWIRKTARQHFWRVCAWYELDDLVQDGVLHYYRILQRYPDVTEPAQLMALFKRAYFNHLNDLSNQRTRTREVLANDLSPIGDGDWILEKYAGPASSDRELLEFLWDCPVWVRDTLAMLMQQPEVMRRPLRRRLDGTRETTNERWCRMTGFEPGINLQRLTRRYLQTRSA